MTRTKQVLRANTITITEHPFCIYKIVDDIDGEVFLLEMEVPPGSKVHVASWFFDHKVRASQVLVRRIWRLTKEGKLVEETDEIIHVVHRSKYGPRTTYRVGKITKPHKFELESVGCGGGIHGYRWRGRAYLTGWIPSELTDQAPWSRVQNVKGRITRSVKNHPYPEPKIRP